MSSVKQNALFINFEILLLILIISTAIIRFKKNSLLLSLFFFLQEEDYNWFFVNTVIFSSKFWILVQNIFYFTRIIISDIFLLCSFNCITYYHNLVRFLEFSILISHLPIKSIQNNFLLLFSFCCVQFPTLLGYSFHWLLTYKPNKLKSFISIYFV